MDFDRAALACIKAALLTLVAVVCLIILGGHSLWWIVPAVLGTYPLSMVYGFIYGMFLGSTHTEEELQGYDEIEEQEQEQPSEDQFYFEELDSDMEFSPEIVGKFKDALIHEYIIVNHPAKEGEKLKCTYNRTVDDINNFSVPVGCWFVLLMPGIVYTAPVEPTEPEPENTDIR